LAAVLKLIAVQPYIVIFVMWRSPWRWTALCAVIDRIAPRFSRYEPLRHAAGLMLGMVSRLDRKKPLDDRRASRTGHPQMVCSICFHARNWDADAVRDDLRDYVIDAFGDLDAALFVDGPADVKKGSDAVDIADYRRLAISRAAA
jgi:hypothetical protein